MTFWKQIHFILEALNELYRKRYSYMWLNVKNIGGFHVILCFIINKMYSLTSKCPAEITVMGMWFFWHPQVTSKIFLSQARLLQWQQETNLWDSITSPDSVY